MYRIPNAEGVRALGAEPIVLDLLDAHAVREAVLETGPDAIVHQATALADVRFSTNFDRTVRKRQFPIVGDGLALEHDRAGIYNIVDDDPAPVREWLPALANVLGATNAKAKRELGWEPRYSSWRQGFVAAYASTTPAEGRTGHTVGGVLAQADPAPSP